MATSGAASLDTVAARNPGTGPQNINSGRGEQFNNTISGGSGNTQYIQTLGGQSAEGLDFEFRERLFVTDPTIDRTNLIDNKGELVSGTCEWILATKEYTEWLHEDTPPLLWIWGGPGKGKTMLSTFISHELEKKDKIIYFFCSAGDEKRNTAVALLRGLLWHLTGLYSALCRQLREETADCLADTLSSRRTLWTRFWELIKALGSERLYCIIDGLDECDEDSRQWLMNQLVSMNSSGDAGNFKISVVSRGFGTKLPDVNQVKLDHDYSEEVRSSVKVFVESKAKDLFRQFDFDQALSKTIELRLAEGAQGIFLWVGFAITDLLKQTRKRRVVKVLEQLPSGLNPLYDRMLDSVEPAQRDIILSLLGYVALACRPLCLDELNSLVRCQQLLLGLSSDENNIRALVEDSAPLMHITGDTVSLVHESLRDYVKKSISHGGLHLVPEEVHLQFSRACIEALAHETSLVQYAIQYWPEHARRAKTLASHLIAHHRWFFCTKSVLRAQWWPKYKSHLQRISALADVDLPQLHMASYLGIQPWVADILGKRRTWFGIWNPCNEKDSEGCTPLHYAANQGFDQVVALLIQHGADANIPDKYKQTASTMASEAGHENAMRALLDSGVDPNVSVLGETLLQCAAKEGHVGMVQLLLHQGARIDSKTTVNGTALHVAITHQRMEVIELLLNSGADVNITDSEQRTALHLVLHCSDGLSSLLRLVTLLLERGASIEAMDNLGHTVLHAWVLHASRHSDSGAVLMLLIQHNACIDAMMGSERMALHAAVRSENFPAAQDLLQQGADVDAADENGETALHLVSEHGLPDFVELLLNNGADIDARNHLEHTPLMLAKYSKVVELLLDRGANIEASTKWGRTALHHHCYFGNEATVKLLLEKGADTNVRDSEGDTPLHDAVHGNGTAAKLLLTHGADIHVGGRNNETALHHAARTGTQETVQLLLDYGADVHAKTNLGETALHQLSRCPPVGGAMVAKVLLEGGADVNDKNLDGETALSIALDEHKRWKPCKKIIPILVAYGADFDVDSKDGKTISQIVQESTDHGLDG